MTREELIESLTILKEQARYYGDNTFIWSINIDSFNFVINSAIKALEQEPTTKNDLGVDAISRVQAQTEIEMNASRYTIAKERGGMGQVEWSDQLIKVSDAVDIIRHLPSVTPQEPITWIVGKNNAQIAVRNMPIDKLQKICAIIGDEQEPIIDKLRAEIDNALSDGMIHKKTVLGIIDKYKAESEDKG